MKGTHRLHKPVLVIGFMLVVLLASGTAWYRADFPVPGMGKGGPWAWLPDGAKSWTGTQQSRLRHWKTGHVTRRTVLSGTLWKASDPGRGGLKLHFGEDGKLSFTMDPGRSTLVQSPRSTKPLFEPRDTVERYFADLSGRSYRFSDEARWPGWMEWLNQLGEPNLLFDDPSYSGFLEVSSGRESMSVYFTTPAGKTAHLIFERAKAPGPSE
jgi:hypothetical protein